MKLSAQKRTGGDAAGLRRRGRLPAVLYNKELNVPVSVDPQEFDKVFRSQGTSHIIDLEVDGSNHEVVVKEVQMNKRRRVPLHVDFYEVTAGEPIVVAVRVDLEGNPVGVKEGGQLHIQRREISVRVLPRYIPDNLSVDISRLAVGDSIHISDVARMLPQQAEVLDDQDLTIVTVVPPRVAEETEETAAAEEAEPEVIGRTGEEEGEAAAEGDEE